jgi:hypothetical protein
MQKEPAGTARLVLLFICIIYSQRRARMGSIDAARQVGIEEAATATNATTNIGNDSCPGFALFTSGQR